MIEWLCFPQTDIEALTPNVMASGGGALKE